MNKLVIKTSTIMLLIWSILFLAPIPLYADAEWDTELTLPEISPCSELQLGLILDRRFSPIVGADLIIFALRGYEALDDCLIPNTEGDASACMILGRSGKYLLEGVLVSTLTVTQHEIFGHGARAREFHLPASYIIRPFSGTTFFPLRQYEELSLHQKAAISAGGMEGNTILAQALRERWLYGNRIDAREAHLYLFSNFDQTLYILHAPAEKRCSLEWMGHEGHDVVSYICQVNTWYGKHALSVSKLSKQTLIDFLDPFFFYSVYNIGAYLITGAQTLCNIPMIPIGDYRYLPGARLSLAPYGPEYQFINYIQSPEHFIKATLRYGHTENQCSQALDLDITSIWTSDLLFLDTRLSLWHQPKLFTHRAKADDTQFGFAAFLIARYQVLDKLEIMGQIGYKTTGFLQGEMLKRGPIARIGLIMQI